MSYDRWLTDDPYVTGEDCYTCADCDKPLNRDTAWEDGPDMVCESCLDERIERNLDLLFDADEIYEL